MTLILRGLRVDHSLGHEQHHPHRRDFSMFVSSVINLILSFVNDQVRSIAF
ncbi:MAG: hypothetical protein ACLUI3_02620 [Christensenellales bacterium]